MSETRKVRDEDFPTEVAFWEANKEELRKQYLGKYLIIRGEEIQGVLTTLDDLATAEEQELADNPALVRYVSDGKTEFSPFSWAVDRA